MADSLNRDLHKVYLWCQLWDMKFNPAKTQSIIVSRSKTINPAHPVLSVCGQDLTVSSHLKLLGVTLDDKLTLEKHIRVMSSSLAQKGGILRKCYKFFQDVEIVSRTFYAFILPCFEYCSPIWMSAAPSHLRLLVRSLNSMRFIVPNVTLCLDSRRETSALSTLFKIFKNPQHPMKCKLPAPFVHRRVTRFSLSLNDYSFQHVRFNSNQYSRCFIPYTCKLWNQLPNYVIESVSVSRFKSALKSLQ